MHFKLVIVGLIGLLIAVISAIFLAFQVQGCILGREQYHSWIPFLIGMAIALAVGLWPVKFIHSLLLRVLIRSLVFTLFLAPVPFGPEGSLFPVLLALIFHPPLLYSFPEGFILTFCAVLGVIINIESIRMAQRTPNKGLQASS